jgi:hypothetical protein
MDRLGLPDKPIALDDEDDGVKSANPSAGAGGGEDMGGKESNEGEPEATEEDGEERRHVSALV